MVDSITDISVSANTDGTIYGLSLGGATEFTTGFGALKFGLSFLKTEIFSYPPERPKFFLYSP